MRDRINAETGNRKLSDGILNMGKFLFVEDRTSPNRTGLFFAHVELQNNSRQKIIVGNKSLFII